MPNRQNYLVRNTDFSALSNDLLCIKGPTLCGKGPLYCYVSFAARDKLASHSEGPCSSIYAVLNYSGRRRSSRQ